jgi:signal transduction histidine kinase
VALPLTVASLVIACATALVAWLAGATAGATAVAAVIALLVVGSVSVVVLLPWATPQRPRLAPALLGVAAAAGATALALGVVVLVMGHLPDAGQRRFVAPAAVAAGLAAAMATTARRHLPALDDRFRAPSVSPADVVRSFGDRTSRSLPDEEVLRGLAEALRRAMALQAAEVWTLAGRELRRTVSVPAAGPAVAAVGEDQVRYLSGGGVFGRAWLEVWLPVLLEGGRVGDARVVPAAHAGDLLGLLVLERARDAAAFSVDDDRALADLGRRVGVVLHNRQLDSALRGTLTELRRSNDELLASRARLVAAADAERRRLERDLHDGAQQHLLALALELRRARAMVDADPAGAGALLDELALGTRAAIAELRDLAHGIYPPLLLESGLGAALRGAAARAPIPVSVDAQLDARYSPEVEAAVYFSCLEALQNVVKHAPGSPAAVRLWRDGSTLRLEVSDEGKGFDVGAVVPGLGLQSIQDRLGAVGGSVEWRNGDARGARMVATVGVGPATP